MKSVFAAAGILAMISLVMTCSSNESPAASALQIQVQGHVYDSQTKQPVNENFVGLYQQRRAETGMFTQEQVADTRTDKDGFYSLRGSVISESCKAGTVKLFLMPISNDNGTGTRVACTDTLQTIDLYK